MPPPPGVRDPLGVLEGILGVPVRVKEKADIVDEVLKLEYGEDIDFGGLSLEEFVQAGTNSPKMREYSEQSVEECKLPMVLYQVLMLTRYR